MPPKPLIAMMVADTLVLAVFTLLFVFHVLPPMRLVSLLILVTLIVDGAFLVWLVRSRRSRGTRPTQDSSELRPR